MVVPHEQNIILDWSSFIYLFNYIYFPCVSLLHCKGSFRIIHKAQSLKGKDDIILVLLMLLQ